MFARIAAFELRYQLRQPFALVSFAVFFLLTFFATVSENVRIGASDAILANSPSAITQTLLVMSLIGMYLPLALLSNAVLRDTDFKMAGIVHSTPVGKAPHLLGRFTGAFAASVLAFGGAAFGMIVGSYMWWLDPQQFGPFRPDAYLYALAVFAVPNLLVMGSLFFLIATVTRNTIAVYAGMIGFLVLYTITSQLLDEPELRDIAALADPLGLSAYSAAVRYWTPFESNERLVPLEGNLLLNRAIWLGVAAAFIAAAYALFSFKERAPRRKDRGDAAEAPAATLDLPRVMPRFDSGMVWQQFALRTRFEAASVVRSPAFLVLLALGMFNALGALLNLDQMFGTPIHPVTRAVSDLLIGSFGIIPLIVVIYYAGELVWREPQAKLHEIVDAMPVPNWVFVASKFIAMALVLACLLAVATLTGMATQLANGFTQLEPGLYAVRLFFLFGVPMILFAVLAIFIQVLAPNKYIGMVALVVVFVLRQVAASLGFEDRLYRFGTTGEVNVSDMNGLGHQVETTIWFMIYWGFASLLLAIASYLLWNRGTRTAALVRLRRVGAAFTPATGALAAAALAGFVLSGGWIFYNTRVVNEFETRDAGEELQVAFEKKYRQYENQPAPRITAVKVDVDLYPDRRGFATRGTYRIENRTGAPLETVHVMLNPETEAKRLEIDGAALESEDREFNYFIYRLSQPMQPGEARTLAFETARERSGFAQNDRDFSVVYNGSFINNMEALPILAFSRNWLIQDRSKRRKHGLPELERAFKLEDRSRWTNNYIRGDSDWVSFETTVSTVPSQIAMAPGYLQREWEADGRRYFHYKMDAPILNFFSWLSAEYAVAHEKWNGIDVSVYHHAPHAWNVPRMIDSVKKSIEYFSAAFSPYQHKQLRILEFPAYATFAQSFPNTVPYSEGIGFVADNSDPEDVDYVFYVTAHEVAHQWWAHQVMGADVQGASALSETLSQYSALMVMEREYGPHQIRKFLKYELDRYLAGRRGEEIEELPLYRVEGQQYIHYQKGSLVMYALKDYVGEATVNRALARLVRETAYKSNPYPTSLDLIRILREEVGPEHQQLVTDLFERIVLFDLKVAGSTVTATPDGKWKVTLEVEAAKREADGKGKETDVPLDMPIDIGVFAADPSKSGFKPEQVLHFAKHKVTSGR
ncbi:MAG TPA: M1 family aminopeptidase, partial [Azospirillaceae bacterium]|nr:M1 family aminopeptidase [Azospirillaceae bacterium]